MTKQYLIDWIRHITLTNSNRLYRIEFKICGHLIWNRLYEIYISIFSLSAFCLQIVFSTVQVRHTYMYKRILKSSEVFFFCVSELGWKFVLREGRPGSFDNISTSRNFPSIFFTYVLTRVIRKLSCTLRTLVENVEGLRYCFFGYVTTLITSKGCLLFYICFTTVPTKWNIYRSERVF